MDTVDHLMYVIAFLWGVVFSGCFWYFLFKGTSKSAYIEGKRAAIKQAIQTVNSLASVAVELSPKGHIQLGLTRAQMAHTIELELRTELALLNEGKK